MADYPQIQAWPTPEIFILRGNPITRLNEFPKAGLLLSTFFSPTPVTDSISDNGNGFLALTTAAMAPSIPVSTSISDSGSGGLLLSTASIYPITPVSVSESEPANASLGLSTFFTPIAANVTDAETGNAAAALTTVTI